MLQIKKNKRIIEIKLIHIIAILVIIIIPIALIFSKSSSAKSDEPKYEINQNQINIQSIIAKNANASKFKEQVIIQADMEFEKQRKENNALPKDEEVISQEGVIGKELVNLVRTYENGQLVGQTVLSRQTITPPILEITDVGTSEFLANKQVHIGDTLYLLEEATLKESSDEASTEVTHVNKSIDVKLLELQSEEWCKVSFDGTEGFIKSTNLTSATVTPEIIEQNRLQRIVLAVNDQMPLNVPSGLTLDDYKKIFTDLPQDINHIFQDNYEVFYNLEEKYKINGIFVASIAAHESAWGTSRIASDRKNLFGYGAYDRGPYEYSFQFSDYAEGIETVAKALVKYYLNSPGEPIFDDQVAEGLYYNGSTVQSVNIRYASDKSWHEKVFSYMQLLYNRLI